MTVSDWAVRLGNVTFGWQAGPPTLDIPTLEVGKGERVFIYGASGSGKSTLLALIAGVLRADGGDIDVIGTSLTSMSASARDRFRAEHMGVIFQTFNLLPFLSISDNIRLGYDFSRARRARVGASEGGADGAIRHLLRQLGLDPAIADRTVMSLSVGQQQRVAVARALIGGPELVIADEPTSALDGRARARFIDLLMQECNAAGSTLLFVSHDLALAEHFDRQLDLADINRAQKSLEPVA